MTLNELQKEIDDWAQQFKTPYWKPHEIIARLAEETGELAREVNHIYGPKKKKSEEETKELGDEMADMIITLMCLAKSHNIDLDDSMEKAFDKINSRDTVRFEKK